MAVKVSKDRSMFHQVHAGHKETQEREMRSHLICLVSLEENGRMEGRKEERRNSSALWPAVRESFQATAQRLFSLPQKPEV